MTGSPPAGKPWLIPCAATVLAALMALGAGPALAAPQPLINYFQPMPIVGKLTSKIQARYLIAFGWFNNNLAGQAFVIFVLVIAAAEASLALGLVVLLFRQKSTLDADAWRELRG